MVTGTVRYGVIAKPTHSTEDLMTEDKMALIDLLQKSGDGDFLRARLQRDERAGLTG